MLLTIFGILSVAQLSSATTTSDYSTDLPGCDMAVMKVNYLLTGILVPWIIAFFLCMINSQIHKRYKRNAATMLFQPVQTVPMVVPVSNQQVFNNCNPQPINYGMTQQGQFAGGMPNVATGYAGYQ